MICSLCNNHSENKLCTSKIDLFKNLPIDIQAKIASSTKHFDAHPGQIIVQEGDKADFLLIIREGKVKINRFDSDGKEYILDILIAGDTIGQDSFMQKKIFEYNIETLGNAKFCQISKDQILKQVRESGDFAVSFIEHLSDKLNHNNEKISLLMENNAFKRIAGFLLERDERLSGDTINLTVDDIAASTNLRRETVSRKLRELQKENVIKRNGQKNLQVIDREKLLDIFSQS